MVCWTLRRADFASVLGKVENLIVSYSRRQRDNESPEALGFARHVTTCSSLLNAMKLEGDVEDTDENLSINAVLFRIHSKLAPEIELTALLGSLAAVRPPRLRWCCSVELYCCVGLSCSRRGGAGPRVLALAGPY